MTTLAIIYEVLKLILFWEIAGFVLFFLFVTPESWKRFKEKIKSRKAAKQKRGGNNDGENK